MAESYRVYWQPGCSSCLKTKEFLSQHGIAFESINVRTVPAAMEELVELGARSVPVVAYGNKFIFAQDLGELARFVGLDTTRELLPMDTLVERLDAIMAADLRYLVQLPDVLMNTPFRGREDRTPRLLGFHIFMIVEGFLDAAQGGILSFDYFERIPPDEARGGSAIAELGERTRARFREWWSAKPELPKTAETYYGTQPFHAFLERTTWHAAQHCRQMMSLLEQHGLDPNGLLSARELDGLPLPEAVWDDD
jgi:glutaredoxin